MKQILCLLLLFIAFNGNAQYFKVTPNGLKDNNEQRDFVVLEFPGKSQEDLYNSSIKFIHQSFKNPESVIKSDIKNEAIRYVSYKSNGMKVSNSGVKVPVEIKYSVQLEFKEGKVKLEIVDQDFGLLAYTGNIWKVYPIWHEKTGKLRLENEKNELENHFNTIAQQYVDFISGKNNSDW